MQLVLTLGIFFLAFAGLAIGVMAGRPPIKGSCGGLDCLKGVDCGACSRKVERDAR